MALDPVVLAPVLAQPGLPATRAVAALDISRPPILLGWHQRTRDGLQLCGYSFEGDIICWASRFQTLRTAVGAAFAGTGLPD